MQSRDTSFPPLGVIVNIYNSLILPYNITYGLIAWGNASNTYLNKILVLQNAIPLFAKAKILPVTFLYYEAISKLMLDVHNQSAPLNIMKLTKTSHIHTYNT